MHFSSALALLHVAAMVCFLYVGTQHLLLHKYRASSLSRVLLRMEGRSYAAEEYADALVALSHRKLKVVRHQEYAGEAERERAMESLEAAHSDEWLYHQPVNEEWLREWATHDPLYELPPST